MYGLRIIIADTDPVFRKYLKEKLLNAGHMVIGEAADGRKALQMTFNTQPDLVILNAQLPERDGLETAKIIEEHKVAPVLLVTEIDRQDEVIQALEHWSLSYILRPVEDTNLFPAIEVCVATFKKICQYEEKTRKLKQSVETRKIVERAKGLLIEFKGMTEQQAFKYIQKLSMDKCIPMHNVAKHLIKALETRTVTDGSDLS
ncbi:ANTAR domain-containing response regulator [Phosphitispora fastidiosa]|uniref:ANTAR domain-containing response regulator n=1 Tax=Phosphitispora fastidiosa TaxID=2837202 RepID=UPI001E50B935|nr:ANTAR domain-containing protein [Phosphitispora fastidiosa]MBU7007973.1 response regulator NasT [Phosphitispora fastidiosa]